MSRPFSKRPRRGKPRPSGYRSKFEEDIAAQFTKLKIKFKYEAETLPYNSIIAGARCSGCYKIDPDLYHCYRPAKYTPDFFLENGVIIETKGKFTSKDRAKAVCVRRSNPDRDIRFLFMRDNTLSKISKTRYSEWARKNDFLYGIGKVTKELVKA